MKILVLMGPPASGKGTMAKHIEQQYGLPHLSTGSVLRERKKKNDALGREIASYIDEGKFLPDALITKMLIEWLRDPTYKDGVILDGYPRTVSQVPELDNIAAALGAEISGVLLINAPEKTLLARVKKRAQAENRADDTEEKFKGRLADYKSKTEPVFGIYKKRGLLYEVDGDGAIPTVTARIDNVLKRLFGPKNPPKPIFCP